LRPYARAPELSASVGCRGNVAKDIPRFVSRTSILLAKIQNEMRCVCCNLICYCRIITPDFYDSLNGERNDWLRKNALQTIQQETHLRFNFFTLKLKQRLSCSRDIPLHGFVRLNAGGSRFFLIGAADILLCKYKTLLTRKDQKRTP